MLTVSPWWFLTKQSPLLECVLNCYTFLVSSKVIISLYKECCFLIVYDKKLLESFLFYLLVAYWLLKQFYWRKNLHIWFLAFGIWVWFFFSPTNRDTPTPGLYGWNDWPRSPAKKKMKVWILKCSDLFLVFFQIPPGSSPPVQSETIK